MVEEAAIRSGTSGWRYAHWRDVLYPAEMAPGDWLRHYANEFNTVEVNSSLFGPLEPNDIKQWCETTPASFRFAIKAPRHLTYDKKLRNCGPELNEFLANCERFGQRLGPVVFQFPPGWRANLRRLDAFLTELSGAFEYVFDLRDPTWHSPDILDRLRASKANFCIYQQHGFSSPLEVTGDIAYIRLHGPGGSTVGSYRSASLRNWVARSLGWNRQGKQAYVFFDNDTAGFAVKNARRFNSFVREGAVMPGSEAPD